MTSEILIQLLRSQWDTISAGWIDTDLSTIPDFDWDGLLAAALEARIAPLLHIILHERAWVPTCVRSTLRQELIKVVNQNIVALKPLSTVLKALNSAGISHILLKGTALALTVYQTEGLRPMSDVDLLVHHEDVSHAASVLHECGYKESAYHLEERSGASLSYENEILFKADNPIFPPVELHWGFFNALHYTKVIKEPWLWDTAEPVLVNDIPGLVLGSEALLLHLCGHLVLHHYTASNKQDGNLLWLHDIALLLSKQGAQINWEMLLSQARDSDLLIPLQTLLPHIVEDWKAPVPERVLTRLAAMQPSPVEKSVVRWLTANDKRHTGWNVWMNARAIPKLNQRIKYVMTEIFPSAQYMRDRYGLPHPILLPFYYVARWLRGIGI